MRGIRGGGQDLSEPVREVMSVEEVAEYLGFSTWKIYRLIRQRAIPSSRIGKQYRFFKPLIDEWLSSKAVAASRAWRIPSEAAASPEQKRLQIELFEEV